MNVTEVHVAQAGEEHPHRVTHGGTAVAAATGLMEHQRAVLRCQFAQQRGRGIRHVHAGEFWHPFFSIPQ